MIYHQFTKTVQQCIGASCNPDSTYRLDFADGTSRLATTEEIDAATLADARASIKPVTRKQMLIALHRAGLLDTIKGAVAASGNIELQIAFDEALTFERNDPFLAAMAAALGKSDAEVDGIFALAASI
jgi:hypothetical protein